MLTSGSIGGILLPECQATARRFGILRSTTRTHGQFRDVLVMGSRLHGSI